MHERVMIAEWITFYQHNREFLKSKHQGVRNIFLSSVFQAVISWREVKMRRIGHESFAFCCCSLTENTGHIRPTVQEDISLDEKGGYFLSPLIDYCFDYTM